jgi:hypothetical protein
VLIPLVNPEEEPDCVDDVLRSDPTLPSTSPLSCEWAAEGMASTALLAILARGAFNLASMTPGLREVLDRRELTGEYPHVIIKAGVGNLDTIAGSELLHAVRQVAGSGR